MTERLFLNEKEVSILTGLSLSTLRNMRWRGWREEGLPYIKLKKKVLYERSEVISWLKDHHVDASS